MNIEEKLFFPYVLKKDDSEKLFFDSANIYTRIKDELSKEIFINRLLFSVTNDFKYVRQLIEMIPAGKELTAWILKNGINAYIYGAGVRGERLARMYPDVRFKGFIDKKKKGICAGYDVYGIEKIDFNDNTYVLVSNMYDCKEIRKNLLNLISEDRILFLSELDHMASKIQYFEERCVGKYKKCESFVDIGCFDGTDSIHFMGWSEEKEKKAYAFEPELNNFSVCLKNLNKYQEICMINKGVSGACSSRKMKSAYEGSVIIEEDILEDGISDVELVTLDSELGDENIKYIKMDIEGNEIDALKGARKIISEQHPMMAISVYHTRDDIIEIPKILLSYYAGYNFSFGHYSVGIMDTVMYAIPADEEIEIN